MREDEIDTLDNIACFLQAKPYPSMELKGGKEAVYKWLEKTLVRFRYMWKFWGHNT